MQPNPLPGQAKVSQEQFYDIALAQLEELWGFAQGELFEVWLCVLSVLSLSLPLPLPLCLSKPLYFPTCLVDPFHSPTTRCAVMGAFPQTPTLGKAYKTSS